MARQPEKILQHRCVRCQQRVADEDFHYAMHRWGRPYCRHCLDEKELENQDFESTVEAAKRRRTTGGTAVQSIGEKRIAEFLEKEKIAFVYDERYRIAGGDLKRREEGKKERRRIPDTE